MNLCWGKRALIFTLSSLINFHRNLEAAAHLPVPQGNLLGKHSSWKFTCRKSNLLYLEFWLVLIQSSLLSSVFSSLLYIILLSRLIYICFKSMFLSFSQSLSSPFSVFVSWSLSVILSLCLYISLFISQTFFVSPDYLCMCTCMGVYVCLCMRICLIQLPREGKTLSVLSQSLTTWIIDWRLFTPWYISYQKRTERCWNFL